MATPFDPSNPEPRGLESPLISIADLKTQVANGDILLATQDSLTDEWFWSGAFEWVEDEDDGWVSFRFGPFVWKDQTRFPDRRALVRVSNMALVRPVKVDSPSNQEINEEFRAGWPEPPPW